MSTLETAETTIHTCLVCKDQELIHAFIATDRNRRVDSRAFEILRCPRCGLGCTIPRLPFEELGRYYPDEYYSLDQNLQMEASRESILFRLNRINRIKRFIPSGRLIDIGSGTGMFLKTARDHGFKVEGLEISKDVTAFGNKTWGLSIKHGNLHDSIFPANRYDVVTLWHVFEHLHEPLTAAKQLFDLTKPGGFLVIAVPNFNSIQANAFRQR
ncbi:MAG: methyltransferase [Bacteroidetes bacterium]|nr:methyltransferase [Bacteroidota bacterium]